MKALQGRCCWRGLLVPNLKARSRLFHCCPIQRSPSLSSSSRSPKYMYQPLENCRRLSSLVTQAKRGGALKELEELQKASVETSPSISKLEWESPLKIILYPDPRLRAKNASIGTFDNNLREFTRDMFEAMYNAADGVGLAAPQVGVNVRLMVFNPTGIRGEEEFVLINPKVIHTNKRKDIEEEGCLSFPKIYGDVQRPTQIKIRAQDLSGKRLDVTFEDWQARIFQHEFDHLQGVLFHDRMNARELSKIRPQLQDLESRFQREQPGVSIQKVA